MFRGALLRSENYEVVKQAFAPVIRWSTWSGFSPPPIVANIILEGLIAPYFAVLLLPVRARNTQESNRAWHMYR